MAQRLVEVNGVRVWMYWKDPKDGPGIVPMRITLDLLRALDPRESFGVTEDEALAAIDALQEAGVQSIPLYEEEAKTAGVEWEEVTA